jgi:hypothetical protein
MENLVHLARRASLDRRAIFMLKKILKVSLQLNINSPKAAFWYGPEGQKALW